MFDYEFTGRCNDLFESDLVYEAVCNLELWPRWGNRNQMLLPFYGGEIYEDDTCGEDFTFSERTNIGEEMKGILEANPYWKPEPEERGAYDLLKGENVLELIDSIVGDESFY